MVIKKFDCPSCNAGCGLLVEVEGNKIIKIKPDPDYPLTKGFCCPKGIALGAIANDKDRVRKPLKRTKNGFEEISWKQAIHEIADRLNQILEINTPHAIGYYMGTNAVHHHWSHSMFVKGFMDAIGSKQMYNAGSVDNNNKFVSQYFLYGNTVVMSIPDFPKTDLLIILGANPAVTNLSLVTCSNIIKVLKDIKKRGGDIYVIDPRRNETAKILTKDNSEHYIPIYPNTDIFLLLAMMNIIFQENLEDKTFLEENTVGLNELRELVKDFTPEIAEKICRIPILKIYDLARKFATTKRAVIYARIGTCLSTFATMNAWAVEVLNIISGKLDKPGGAIFGKNIISIAKLAGIGGVGGFDEYKSRTGRYPSVMGAFPLGILAREILIEKNPIKALIISGGNPLLSSPNSNEFREALDKLDICVVLDFYISETAHYKADYILPVRTPLENSIAPNFLFNYQVFPHIGYSHRVVDSDEYGPKPEWEILLSLTNLMGQTFFGNPLFALLPKIYKIRHKKFNPEIFMKIFMFFGQLLEKKIPRLSSGTFTMKKLKRSETTLLGNNEYGVLKKHIQTKNKKITLLNNYLREQFQLVNNAMNEKLETGINELKENEFLMIGRRNLKTMNSWMHNVDFLWHKKQEQKLYINSDDAKRLNLINDDIVIVRNNLGSISTPIQITDDVMPSVICYPHGWGHKNPYLSVANRNPGENVNVLTDSKKLEKIAGMPLMNGYKVEIEKI